MFELLKFREIYCVLLNIGISSKYDINFPLMKRERFRELERELLRMHKNELELEFEL